jgi:hypothetical protein
LPGAWGSGTRPAGRAAAPCSRCWLGLQARAGAGSWRGRCGHKTVARLLVAGARCWYMLGPRSRGATQTRHLEPRTLPAQGNVSCLIFPLHQGKWPRLPLTRESRATNEHAILPPALRCCRIRAQRVRICLRRHDEWFTGEQTRAARKAGPNRAAFGRAAKHLHA